MSLEWLARIKYLKDGGKAKLRKYYHSPIYNRVTDLVGNTKIGQLSN